MRTQAVQWGLGNSEPGSAHLWGRHLAQLRVAELQRRLAWQGRQVDHLCDTEFRSLSRLRGRLAS